MMSPPHGFEPVGDFRHDDAPTYDETIVAGGYARPWQADVWEMVQGALADDYVLTFLVHEELGDIATAEVRDVTEWTFPDGTPGFPHEGTLLSLHRFWQDRSG
jgi:hypothetical protein